jgi:16S rRNA (adenine1518-N6/adenine1519-N6)-dimethyltransferase
VVDRICSSPGSKKYGKLSVMMQYYCATEWLFDVSPGSFSPVPKVTSAIIRLVPHATPTVVVNDVKAFNKVVTQAFSQRRKTVRNSLKSLINENTMIELGVNPNARAETLSLADFARLGNRIATDINDSLLIESEK